MPVFIKPRSQVYKERAVNDAAFYYDYFSHLLLDNNTEEKDMATHQDLLRLKRWVASYIIFAAEWHRIHFIPGDDLYSNKEDAVRFTHGTKIPRAPFIEVFEDLPDASL